CGTGRVWIDKTSGPPALSKAAARIVFGTGGESAADQAETARIDTMSASRASVLTGLPQRLISASVRADVLQRRRDAQGSSAGASGTGSGLTLFPSRKALAASPGGAQMISTLAGPDLGTRWRT